MFKNLTSFANLLRGSGQITARIQEVKAGLKTARIQGKCGRGFVQVEMNGMGELHRITISQELVSLDRHAELETLVCEAVGKAILEARRMHVAAIKDLTGGIDLPGMDKIMAELE